MQSSPTPPSQQLKMPDTNRAALPPMSPLHSQIVKNMVFSSRTHNAISNDQAAKEIR